MLLALPPTPFRRPGRSSRPASAATPPRTSRPTAAASSTSPRTPVDPAGPITGGEPETLLTVADDQLFIESPVWRPDGKAYAFTRFVRVGTGGHGEIVIRTLSGEQAVHPLPHDGFGSRIASATGTGEEASRWPGGTGGQHHRACAPRCAPAGAMPRVMGERAQQSGWRASIRSRPGRLGNVGERDQGEIARGQHDRLGAARRTFLGFLAEPPVERRPQSVAGGVAGLGAAPGAFGPAGDGSRTRRVQSPSQRGPVRGLECLTRAEPG